MSEYYIHMKDYFQKDEKILALLSGNKCELCGDVFKNFEGDHKIFSKKENYFK